MSAVTRIRAATFDEVDTLGGDPTLRGLRGCEYGRGVLAVEQGDTVCLLESPVTVVREGFATEYSYSATAPDGVRVSGGSWT